MSNGILYPDDELNRIVGPMLPGDMTVIVGQSAAGKSTFIRHVLEGTFEQDTVTLYHSFEMSRKRIFLIEACRNLGWDFPDIRQGNVERWGTREELEHAYLAVKEMYKDVTFVEGLNHHAQVVLENLERWLIKPEIQARKNRLVVVDHMLQMVYGKGGDATTGQIRHFLNAALDICKQYNAHFMPVSQLSPAGSLGYRNGLEPSEDWCFGSSAMKHLADTMLFVGGKLRPKQKKGLAALGLTTTELYEPGKTAISCLKSRDYGRRFCKKTGTVIAGMGARVVYDFVNGSLFVDHSDNPEWQEEKKQGAKAYLERIAPGSSKYS